MRIIYLIRHGEPDFPNGKRFCLSKTNLHLSVNGRMQGVLLKYWLKGKNISGVYHSELFRAQETAVFLSERTHVVENFHEISVGKWEGLTFEEIQKQYPKLYKNRIKNPIVNRIPSSEAASVCLNRALHALENLLKKTEGDIAVVAHASVNRILLCDLLGRPLKYYLEIPQPYGCVNILQEDHGNIIVKEIAIQPRPTMSESLCKDLLKAADTPDHVIKHCDAVARRALQTARDLVYSGINLDLNQLKAAALLHDIARTEKNHSLVGAQRISDLGYPEIARIIANHHDLELEGETEISEAAVLFLADKLIQEDQEVTLERRFTSSEKNVLNQEAKQAHLRRYEQAKCVARKIEQQLEGTFL